MAKWSPIWGMNWLSLKKRKELIQEARLTPPSKKPSKAKKYPNRQVARLKKGH